MVTSSELGRRLATLALLWLAGLYLRLPILVAPPLAPLIGAELDLNQTQIGALTTIPVLMLSLGALPGAFVISRTGPVTALVLALVVLTLASAGRGLAPPTWILFAATVLLGLAVAVMQPAFPALVVRWCPKFLALGSAMYMNGMLMGEYIGAGLTLPVLLPWLQAEFDGGWRAVLVAWSLPALLVAGLILFAGALWRKGSRQPIEPGRRAMPNPTWRPPWQDPRLWQLSIIMGAGSSGFFGANAYMGSMLAARGEAARLGEFLLWFNGTQVVGSVAMLGLGFLLVGRRWAFLTTSIGVFIGLLGLSVGPLHLVMASVLVLGLCTCIQLILAVSLVPQIADARGAAPLAAGIFTVGYLLGFVIPLCGGIAADLTGNGEAALLPTTLLAAVGVGAALKMRPQTT